MKKKRVLDFKFKGICPDGIANSSAEYRDSFYEEFIANFQLSTKRHLFYRFIKRFLDIIISAFLLAFLSPLMFLIAVAIKCDSKGPAIFKQKRVGKDGKTFQCYKFRSMRVDAPKNCATSLMDHSINYQTKVGKVLRRLSLDELPQLWCVLIGTMSFIGYRPLILNEKHCNDMRQRLGVFAMRPGISGYAQVRGRDDVYYKNKAIMDAYYVKNASFIFDMKLVARTVAVVLNREGNLDEENKSDR